MEQLCQRSDNLSHLTGFGVISNVSDLLYFIVYVTVFTLLLDRMHGVLVDRHLKYGNHMTRCPWF